MEEQDREERRRSFYRIAEAYDRYRPGYPAEMVDWILSVCEIGDGGHLLEIGSGTGKATMPFAQRALNIVCIEPAGTMASVGRLRLKDYPHVQFEQKTFEEWDLTPEAFDLVYSAQAFHWVNQEVGYDKAAQALRPGGHLALFWNTQPALQNQIGDEIEQAYQKYAPMMEKRPWKTREQEEEEHREQLQAIAGSGRFEDVQLRRFPWSKRYTAQEYLGLLGTYSDHAILPKENRTGLLEQVAAVIDRHGGLLERPYETIIYLANKA
jgi:SAM-dependent methyltransferase